MSIHTAGAAAARAAAGLPPRSDTPAMTLPQAGARELSLNEDQLHDLTYHAATSYLYQLSAMTKATAQLHAGRIANAAVMHALASGYRVEAGEGRG